MSPPLLDARRPAAFFANGIGDHLLNLPALRALAALFPERLTLICSPGARDRFFSDLQLRMACEADMEVAGTHRLFDVDDVARRVGDCDLLLSLNPWHSPSVNRLLERLAPADSVGFFPAFRTVLPLDYEKNSGELAFDVVRCVSPGFQLEDFAAPPQFPAVAVDAARRLRRTVAVPRHVLVAHADTQDEKMWPAERWIALLDCFLTRHPDFVVFVVGSRDLSLDGGRCGDRVVPCLGLPLEVSLALVGEADLFAGVDSCMLHAADLYRVPGMGLFGPTSSNEFGFRFGPHRHVCGAGAMASIDVREAADALETLWAATSHSKRECASS